ncbi:MAG: hypothetical protein AAF483_20155 [Planctomycetota bacterium]
MSETELETKSALPRRSLVLGAGAILSTASLLGTASGQENTDSDEKANDSDAESSASKDRKAIMAAGLNEAEADCWAKIAEAAGAFFELPELHPLDKSEVATAVHVIQNKLLGRPTYRTYIASHKAQSGEANEKEN